MRRELLDGEQVFVGGTARMAQAFDAIETVREVLVILEQQIVVVTLLRDVIDKVHGIHFTSSEELHTLGALYESLLREMRDAAGDSGEFYTPRCVVKLLVEMLEPYKGRVYDPCCGSSGMFVQSEEFIVAHGGRLGDISIYGQESNYTTWRLAKMNLAIRGIENRTGDLLARGSWLFFFEPHKVLLIQRFQLIELLLELGNFRRRRAQQGSIDRLQTPQGWTRGGATRLVLARRPELRVELGIAGLKEAHERTRREARADGLHLGKFAALPEHAQEGGGLPLRFAVRPQLVEDDGPGNGREQEQDQQDGLGYQTSPRDESNNIRAWQLAGPSSRLRRLRIERKGVERHAQTVLRT